MDKQSSNQKSVSHPIKRFASGALAGIFLSSIYLSYSIFFANSTPSVIQGTIGVLISTIGCGAIATFASLEKLMDNFPSI